MAGTQVNPTRMELTRLKKKLVTAVRGHKLLKDKRDELMRQFLDKVRENKALREEVETALVSANQNFMLARAGMPDEILNTALLAPKQELTISAGTQNVMSVEIPDFDFKTRTPDQNDMYSYGFVIAPGKDGLVHISKLDRKRVEKVEDVVTVGDMIWVKFMEIDEKGRWNLSRKDALIEIEAQQAAAKAAEQQ